MGGVTEIVVVNSDCVINFLPVGFVNYFSESRKRIHISVKSSRFPNWVVTGVTP